MADPSVHQTPAPPSDTLPSSFDSNPEFFEEKRLAKLGRRLREEPLIPLGCLATCYALYQASKSIRAGDHHQTNRMFRARIYAQGFTLVALVGGSIFWKDDRMKRKELERALEEKRKAEKREKWLRELEQRDREDREWRARFEDTAARAKEAEGGGKSAGSRAGQMGTEMGGSAQKVSKEGTKGAGARADLAVNKVEQGSEKVKEEGTKNAAAVAVQGIDKVEEGVEKVWNEAVDGTGKGKDRMKAAIDKPFPNKSVLEQVERTGWGRGMWSVKEAWRRR